MGVLKWIYRQSLSDRHSGSVASRFRQRRWDRLKRELALHGSETVIDVGGTDKSWWFVDWDGRVVRCNLDRLAAASGMRVVANGCQLPFSDQSFDIAFSNSVIEHVGTWEAQTAFADEVRRVGRKYFVQTPNRHFPIESHYLFPFFQFLPVTLQRWLHTHFDIRTFKLTDPSGPFV
jgi:hypothetical protein